MEDLVAERVLATYRNRHDGKSLDLFASDVIGKANCDYLYRDRIVLWIGEGAEIELPPDMFGHGMKGTFTKLRTTRRNAIASCTRTTGFRSLRSSLPHDERAKYPEKAGNLDDAFVDKNRPVLDRLFVIRESEGRTTWDILRECPKSPRDQPSGRHEVVDSIPGRS